MVPTTMADSAAKVIASAPPWLPIRPNPKAMRADMPALTGGLVGGLGLTASGNIGQELAVFEAVHGTAPDIAGRGIANPTALIRSGALMLEHLGEIEAASRIETAIRAVITAGQATTGDLGGRANTKQFTDAVIALL